MGKIKHLDFIFCQLTVKLYRYQQQDWKLAKIVGQHRKTHVDSVLAFFSAILRKVSPIFC